MPPNILDFWVDGEPAPQGSKRHVGGGRLIESSTKVAPWRRAVHNAAVEAVEQQAWSEQDADQPLTVKLKFWIPQPKSHPKTLRSYPAVKPDLDKYIRSTFDALTTAGALKDDGRVTRVIASKHYVHNDARGRLTSDSDRPGAEIHIQATPAD